MPKKSRRTAAELVALRARLAALYPFLRGDRAAKYLRAIRRIDAMLGRTGRPDPAALLRAEDASAGVRGVGGLDFVAASPPGRGRLIRIPMYLIATPGSTVIAGGTAGGLSSFNPIVIVQFNGGSQVVKGMTLQTPMLGWASWRLVGFQVEQFATTTTTLDADHNAVARPFLLCKNLVAGGGANLLPHPGYIDAAVYDFTIPELCGLRDNPVIEKTNQVTVQMAATGVPQGGASDPQRITYAAWCVGEIIEDDDVGAPIPGPYARPGALARRPWVEGT